MASWYPHNGEQLTDLTRWQMRFEEERVKIVLKAFKLRSHLQDLLNDCEDLWGDRRLTFDCLNRCFPTFPILLAARCHSHMDKACRPAALFRSFEDTFLFESYLEIFTSAQGERGGRPIGMIVPFDGYRGGMIVHNANDAKASHYCGCDTRRLRMIYDVPGDAAPYRLTVEPFLHFIKYIARGSWSPTEIFADAGSDAELSEQPQVTRAMPIFPWMTEKAGTGPALVVLAWLLKVLHSRSGYDRLFVHRASEHERCVVATHEQIAAETRLSLRKVKRGLEALRRKGLVISRRRQNGSSFLITSEVLESLEVGQ